MYIADKYFWQSAEQSKVSFSFTIFIKELSLRTYSIQFNFEFLRQIFLTNTKNLKTKKWHAIIRYKRFELYESNFINNEWNGNKDSSGFQGLIVKLHTFMLFNFKTSFPTTNAHYYKLSISQGLRSLGQFRKSMFFCI